MRHLACSWFCSCSSHGEEAVEEREEEAAVLAGSRRCTEPVHDGAVHDAANDAAAVYDAAVCSTGSCRTSRRKFGFGAEQQQQQQRQQLFGLGTAEEVRQKYES